MTPNRVVRDEPAPSSTGKLGAPQGGSGQRGAIQKLRDPLERDVQRAVAQFYKLCGIKVYNLSQGYRPGGKRHATTRQTKGLGDLYCCWPDRMLVFWHETKRVSGKQSPEQVEFEAVNKRCGVTVVVGGLQQAREFVARIRNVEADPWP